LSNKKRKAKLEKEKKRYEVHRFHVHSGFEMLKISFGLLMGFSSVKGYKLRSSFFTWLAKGSAVSTASKFGISLLAKKLILLSLAISGGIYVYGMYKKSKSLRPVLVSEKGLTIFYPGPFRRSIEIRKDEIKQIELILEKHGAPYTPGRFPEWRKDK